MVANLQKAQWLPPYDERLKVVLDEVDHLWKKNEELLRSAAALPSPYPAAASAQRSARLGAWLRTC